MSTSELQLSRGYDLPAAIVWDALVDEDLVEGWLAAARIDPQIGGLYWLAGAMAVATTSGLINSWVLLVEIKR